MIATKQDTDQMTPKRMKIKGWKWCRLQDSNLWPHHYE